MEFGDLLVMSRTLEEEFTGTPVAKVQQQAAKGDDRIEHTLKGMQDMRGRLESLKAATASQASGVTEKVYKQNGQKPGEKRLSRIQSAIGRVIFGLDAGRIVM